jgi:hypothetical protein
MRLPKLDKPDRYKGLYIFDFGDHAGVGFTAEEVAELLESERYGDAKVYKIHQAYPDGRLELKGVPAQRFQLEAGMFFYSSDAATAKDDFKRLTTLAVQMTPPCRAKVHLVQYADDRLAVGLIYPAEFDHEVSRWLLAGDYRTAGEVEGGVGAVEKYYLERPKVLDQHQLFGATEIVSRTGEELLACVGMAVQR